MIDQREFPKPMFPLAKIDQRMYSSSSSPAQKRIFWFVDVVKRETVVERFMIVRSHITITFLAGIHQSRSHVCVRKLVGSKRFTARQRCIVSHSVVLASPFSGSSIDSALTESTINGSTERTSSIKNNVVTQTYVYVRCCNRSEE